MATDNIECSCKERAEELIKNRALVDYSPKYMNGFTHDWWEIVSNTNGEILTYRKLNNIFPWVSAITCPVPHCVIYNPETNCMQSIEADALIGIKNCFFIVCDTNEDYRYASFTFKNEKPSWIDIVTEKEIKDVFAYYFIYVPSCNIPINYEKVLKMDKSG